MSTPTAFSSSSSTSFVDAREDDALLDVEEAERRIKSTESSRTAHCAEIPIIEAQQNATHKKIQKRHTNKIK